MLRILIADDEPKIRRGIKASLDWEAMGMEVIAEAEDGRGAYNLIKEQEPDLALLDINMPFMDGLELIEQINKLDNPPLIIIVTGYDDFNYAKKALQLDVFDYLLKPVNKVQLYDTLGKAAKKLQSAQKTSKYLAFAKSYLERNIEFLTERFFNDFLSGRLTYLEAQEEMSFLNIEPSDKNFLLVSKIQESNIVEQKNLQMSKYAIINIFEEISVGFEPKYVFMGSQDDIILIANAMPGWEDLEDRAKKVSQENLKQPLNCRGECSCLEDITACYEKLTVQLQNLIEISPIVQRVINYIETNYSNSRLSLEEVADNMQLSPNYLSRLLKNEIGQTFSDFVTKERIKKALILMDDPFIKIYEVAEKVGYKNQYYFSTAFKKVLGCSPLDYKRKRELNKK